MLQNLHVKNLALIEEANVELKEGLNILSGETGAGKSIIIGSINLALGEKASKEFIRDTGEEASVELLFEVTNEQVLEKLKELDVDVEDGQVLLSRKLSNQKSTGRINGACATASMMREVAALLIDIHGQHDHQSLLHKRKHLELVDDFATQALGNRKELLRAAYEEYKALKEEYDQSNLEEEARNRELDLLRHEVQEIEEAHLTLGEDELLEAEFSRFSNGRKIMEGVGAAYSMCGGEEEGAANLIGRALREISVVAGYDPAVAELSEQLTEIDNLLGDVNHGLAAYLDNADFDEEHFYEVSRRLDVVNHLKDKYRCGIAQILEQYEAKSEEIAKLMDFETYISTLQNRIAAAEKQLMQLAEEVSLIRQREAETLCEKIRDALMDLNFLDVRFEMRFNPMKECGPNGYDDAEFLISVNPGEPLMPLAKVASGGELSRIMLAIKTVMAEGDAISTLIFDEIDSGISGRTAQMVSEKMNELGRNHQIICITHLPQIAAMADAHFLIEKSVNEMSTVSFIREMNEEESVCELARMLGGVEITDTVMDSAREMKVMAQRKKLEVLE